MLEGMSPNGFAFYKFLGLAALPLTWISALLFTAVALLWLPTTPRRISLAKWTGGGSLLLLWGLSAGPISAYLVGTLEQVYPPWNDLAPIHHDAIVVLASGVLTEAGARPSAELTPATLQNMLCGAKAFADGASIRLVLSGDALETGEMARFANKLGVPNEAIVIEQESRSTYENALHVRRILPPTTDIVLIASAMHTPRAVRTFQRQGFTVTPYPCGYLTSLKLWAWPQHSGVAWYIPSSFNLERSTMAIHEIIGLAIYELLGNDS